MHCDRASELLCDHLYQDLPQVQQTALEEHLEHCSACAERFRQMRAVSGWLTRNAAPLPRSASPVPLLMRQSSEWRRNARRWRRGALLAGALAAAVLVAMTVVDHVTWKDGSLAIVFHQSDQPVAPRSSDDADLRLVAAQQRIADLEAAIERLAVRQADLLTLIEQDTQNRSALVGGPINPTIPGFIDDDDL